MRPLHLPILFVASALCACAGGGNRPAPGGGEGVQRVVLTAAQGQAIEGGVKQMMEQQDGVKISAVSATRQPGKTGLQVCGFTSARTAAGKFGPELPFYIELLDKDGKPVAERGQVGSDPARLSKVKFMCRANG